jgi:methionyl aminopeptidase
VLRRKNRIKLKTTPELEIMREAGRMVAEVLEHLRQLVTPGVTTGDLNEAAGEKMAQLGGTPSFLGYKGYPANVCISIDEEIVHGIPGRCRYEGRITPDRALEAGQIVSLDCGVIHDGYHGDSAVTLVVGEVPDEVNLLLDTCRGALWAGIEQVRPGNRLTDVAKAIENHIKGQEEAAGRRYGIVRDYVGHGIGRSLHEDPQVPNYVSGQLRRNDLELQPGLVIAIEPMVCLGTHRTRQLHDGWTVVTRDKKHSCHFEHTVAVTSEGFEVLTRRGDGGATH